MSYSNRDQARIHRMAARCGVTDIDAFAEQTMGTTAWKNFNHGEAATFEAAIERHAQKPATAAPRFDRQANRVAGLAGLPTPKATGRCHYCGLPLNRQGQCEECV
ncbi:hypothetical protein ACWIGW_44485 [Nocardia brasiliensis]